MWLHPLFIIYLSMFQRVAVDLLPSQGNFFFFLKKNRKSKTLYNLYIYYIIKKKKKKKKIIIPLKNPLYNPTSKI